MAFKMVGNCIVTAHNENPPTHAEAEAFLAMIRDQDMGKLRSLVLTDGGAPGPAHRQQFNELLAGRDHLTAVVTSVTMVRGVVTAFSWFNKKIKAFSPDKMEDALRYLDLHPSEFRTVLAEAEKLKRSVTRVPAPPK